MNACPAELLIDEGYDETDRERQSENENPDARKSMPADVLGTNCNVANKSGDNEQQPRDEKEREQGSSYWISGQNETTASKERENDHEYHSSESGPECSHS